MSKQSPLRSSAGPSSSPSAAHHRVDNAEAWEASEIRRDRMDSGWGEDEGDEPEARRSFSFPGSSTARIVSEDFVVSGGRGGESAVPPLPIEGGWNLDTRWLRPLPPFYPVDKMASRRLNLTVEAEENVAATAAVGEEAKQEGGHEAAADEHHLRDISRRLSEACRILSIQVDWNDNRPSATLFTMERVVMELSLYSEDSRHADPWAKMPPVVHAAEKPPPPGDGSSDHKAHVLVEVQRRKGCPVAFHSYLRKLLDAAEGKFDPRIFHKMDGIEKPGGRTRFNAPRATMPLMRSVSMQATTPKMRSVPMQAKKPKMRSVSMQAQTPKMRSVPMQGKSHGMGLARPALRAPSFSADFATSPSKEGMASAAGLDGGIHASGEQSSSDATTDKTLQALNIAASLIKKDRMDARRLGMESLVLLTDPIRAGMETARIASRVVLTGTAREDLAFKSHDEDDDDDIDDMFDESAGLGIRETLLEMMMGDENKMSDGIEKELIDELFHLSLSVLSNALETLHGKHDALCPDPPTHIMKDDNSEEDNRKPSPTNRKRASTEPTVRPSMTRGLSKKFIDDTNSTFGCDVLSSLMRVLSQAKHNPHDAYHSARCLGVLFKGCGTSHKARAQRDLDAKRIITAALDVGSRTHTKLYDASKVAMASLVTDDEQSMEESKTELEAPEVEEVTNETDEMNQSNDEMEQEESEEQQQSSLHYRQSPLGKSPPHGNI